MKSRLRSSEVDVGQDKAGNLRNLASGQAIQGNGRKVPRLSRRTKLGRRLLVVSRFTLHPLTHSGCTSEVFTVCDTSFLHPVLSSKIGDLADYFHCSEPAVTTSRQPGTKPV